LKKLFALLVSATLLSGCGFTLDSSQTQQDPETANADSQMVWDLTDSPQPAQFCKIPDARPEPFRGQARGHTVDGLSYGGPSGFPLVELTVPTTGQLDWLFILVAFEDTPRFVETPAEFMEPHVGVLEDWAEFWSQGKLQFNIQFVDYWLELPMKAKDFPKDRELYIAKLLEDQLPDGMIFADFDATYIQWDNLFEAPGAAAAATSGDTRYTLRIGSNELFYEDEALRPNLVWAPSYNHASNRGHPIEHKQKFAYGHWLHELLHEMGLNLHAPGNGWPTGVGQVLYPYNPDGSKWSQAISAWEQFLVTWLDDSQVHCVDRSTESETRTVLTPLESYGGDRKLIAIPSINDEDELLAIEARLPGERSYWSQSDFGLLVYRVDPTAKHRDHIPNECGNDPDVEKWAYYLFPDNAEVERNHCGHFSEALVRPGETLSYEGIVVKLESVVDGKFYVNVNFGGVPKEATARSVQDDLGVIRKSVEPTCGCCGCFPGTTLH
jgi:hypothetical protein